MSGLQLLLDWTSPDKQWPNELALLDEILQTRSNYSST